MQNKMVMQNSSVSLLKRIAGIFLFSFFLALVIAGCDKDKDETELSRAEILSSVRWKTTVVKDSVGTDVTAENQGFVGLATYNKDGTYAFFNLDGTPRGDSGYWALTVDGSKRIIVSLTRNYTRVVDILELNKNIFTYKVVANGKTVTVEHVPL